MGFEMFFKVTVFVRNSKQAKCASDCNCSWSIPYAYPGFYNGRGSHSGGRVRGSGGTEVPQWDLGVKPRQKQNVK